jgi:hypothetical protein
VERKDARLLRIGYWETRILTEVMFDRSNCENSGKWSFWLVIIIFPNLSGDIGLSSGLRLWCWQE